MYRELCLLANAGLTGEQVLRSATNDAAVALGVEDRTGTIEVGKDADLVLLSENPLASMENIRTVVWVMRGGVLAHERAPSSDRDET